MEELLLEILNELRAGHSLDARALEAVIRRHNHAIRNNRDHFAKKHLLPYYLAAKKDDPARWASWNVDEELERHLMTTVRVKPRRTASGVATISVLTKPWPCASRCLYCPNDVRMPKSYLTDEPACQRAERVWFDPYLQVMARLTTLVQMGHTVDKVELIVLGGTWSDYPQGYQVWFVRELFAALNAFDARLPLEEQASVADRRAFYRECGVLADRDELRAFVAGEQRAVDAGETTYNEAFERLYRENPAWQAASARQHATLQELEAAHAANEQAAQRAVGLVVETRPDTVTAANLRLLRQLGCTKVQMGIQSLDERILRLNHRGIGVARIHEALALLRLFGFKTHVHFMANLLGATLESDRTDYARLVRDPACLPDEVKIYPCALVAGAELCAHHADGSWRPYTEAELLEVLSADLAVTPPYTRVSRMIRDISSHDILVGNKKVNLRQLVERHAEREQLPVVEIRSREIGTTDADTAELSLEDLAYDTTVSQEHFLQWTTPEGRIAGFLRLSLPNEDAVRALGDAAPVLPGEAMIREVHVYGRVAGIHQAGVGAQHAGLGRQLVERACEIAHAAGYERMNVISAVGTRAYYRRLGFADHGLYQQRTLQAETED